jgi:hypothetical protein
MFGDRKDLSVTPFLYTIMDISAKTSNQHFNNYTKNTYIIATNKNTPLAPQDDVICVSNYVGKETCDSK